MKKVLGLVIVALAIGLLGAAYIAQRGGWIARGRVRLASLLEPFHRHDAPPRSTSAPPTVDVTQTPGATAVRDALVKVASGAAPLTPLIVTYDDLHALHGGLTLTIHGDGTIEQTVQRVAAGAPRGKVLREDCLRLVSLLVKREAWVQLVADRTMVPDESRIFLRIAYGTDLVEIWEWYDSQESAGRIAGIRELMKDIAWQDRKKTYRD